MIWGEFLGRNMPTVFILQMAVGIAMFTRKFPRRHHFLLRVAGCTVSLLILSALGAMAAFSCMPTVGFSSMIVLFFILFLLCSAGIKVCFHCSLYDALFCGITAYAVQNGLHQFISMLEQLVMQAGVDLWAYPVIPCAILALTHLLCFSGAYWLLARKGAREHYPVSKVSFVILTCVMLVVVLRVLPTSDGMSASHLLAWCFLHLLCCVLSLYILFGMSRTNSLQQELDTMQQMWRLKEEHYVLSRELTESLNIKHHDLRYQLEALRTCADSEQGMKALRELEQSLDRYDAIAKTGNKALDTILTEKHLFCEKNGIKLTYMADGGILDFMQTTDIYAIFGNALDNAIESVMKIEDSRRRIITLCVSTNEQLLRINLQNSFDGDLKVKDGLPVTSKSDAGSHGFGMKSIRLLANKYNGEMTFGADGGIFTLNILLPITQNQK